MFCFMKINLSCLTESFDLISLEILNICRMERDEYEKLFNSYDHNDSGIPTKNREHHIVTYDIIDIYDV